MRTQGEMAMRRILFSAALLLGSVGVQAQSIGGPPFIAVHGKAKAEIVPDIFPLEITLSETSKDAAKTQTLIEGLARQVVELTQAMEMANRDVTVSSLDVSPEYRYSDRNDTETFLGNTYQRQIKLRFHTLADLQKMISSLPQVKQVRLNTGSFQTSRSDELRRQLLSQAVDDARFRVAVFLQAGDQAVLVVLGAARHRQQQGRFVDHQDGGVFVQDLDFGQRHCVFSVKSGEKSGAALRPIRGTRPLLQGNAIPCRSGLVPRMGCKAAPAFSQISDPAG